MSANCRYADLIPSASECTFLTLSGNSTLSRLSVDSLHGGDKTLPTIVFEEIFGVS